jgi:hypothetical protein
MQKKIMTLNLSRLLQLNMRKLRNGKSNYEEYLYIENDDIELLFSLFNLLSINFVFSVTLYLVSKFPTAR